MTPNGSLRKRYPALTRKRPLLAEHAPATSLEAMLLRRLASALWRQERADRLEAAQFAWVEPRRALRGERFVPVDPEAGVCLASLDAIRRGREAAAREVFRVLREPLAAGTDEPEPAAATVRNEPEPRPAAANANARNEPEAPPPATASDRSPPAAGRARELSPEAPERTRAERPPRPDRAPSPARRA